MNHYQKYLEVLVKDNSTLKISAIQDWLEEYENYFKFLIGETSCRKWSKWLEDKSTHIFPCICKLREASCVFIETYYELQKIIDLYYRQEKIAEVLKEFDQIKNNQMARICRWNDTRSRTSLICRRILISSI